MKWEHPVVMPVASHTTDTTSKCTMQQTVGVPKHAEGKVPKVVQGQKIPGLISDPSRCACFRSFYQQQKQTD